MKIKFKTASEVKNSSRSRTLAHETRKNKQMITMFEKNIRIMFAIVVFAVVAGIFVGCQRETPENDKTLDASEYLILDNDHLSMPKPPRLKSGNENPEEDPEEDPDACWSCGTSPFPFKNVYNIELDGCSYDGLKCLKCGKYTLIGSTRRCLAK